MKTKDEINRSANESQVELKYCERCGGLWLRRVGEKLVYCAGCAREMVKLPPVSHAARSVETPHEPLWDGEERAIEGYELGDGLEVDALEGAE